MQSPVPIIDLFSGPGGLSEGFSSHGGRDWTSVLSEPLDGSEGRKPAGAALKLRYRIGLSVEKDPIARRTLRLRAFFRQFERGRVPNAYYQVLRGEISDEELFRRFPLEASLSDREAWNATLGEIPQDELDTRISRAIGRTSEWVLIGGPPCQAYSLVGRSRNKGIDGYRPEADPRHFLYREYLRIVARHQPAVFVMENVKGLLSSRVGGEPMFDLIRQDLSFPGRRVPGSDRSLEYRVVPFTTGDLNVDANGTDFILRMETLGIPQARHRVILLGIRKDLAEHVTPLMVVPRKAVAAQSVLSGLPKLSATVSGSRDASEWRRVIEGVPSRPWFRELSRFEMEDVQEELTKFASRVRVSEHRCGAEFVDVPSSTRYAKDWYLDSRIGGTANHSARGHMATDLERYFFAAAFASVRSRSPGLGEFPPSLLPEHKNASRAAAEGALFSDRFRVQIAGRPSTTVTSHISKDGHYYIHPDPLQCRSLTVREAARLQTFPDNYYFCGPRTQQYHQVGNAVPPLLAAQLAGIVAQILVDARSSKGISRVTSGAA